MFSSCAVQAVHIPLQQWSNIPISTFWETANLLYPNFERIQAELSKQSKTHISNITSFVYASPCFLTFMRCSMKQSHVLCSFKSGFLTFHEHSFIDELLTDTGRFKFYIKSCYEPGDLESHFGDVKSHLVIILFALLSHRIRRSTFTKQNIHYVLCWKQMPAGETSMPILF